MNLSRNISSGFSDPIILSGCASGGKSSLLIELKKRGYQTMSDTGQRVYDLQLASNDGGSSHVDLVDFSERAAKLCIADFDKISKAQMPFFFDQSIIDIRFKLIARGFQPPNIVEETFRNQIFHKTVFFVPPWDQIFDSQNPRHGDFSVAVRDYSDLCSEYNHLGYDIIVLDKVSVTSRADFIESWLINRQNMLVQDSG